MVYGQGFLSTTRQHNPDTPVQLQSANSPDRNVTLKDLINVAVPEFQDGSVSVLNPLLFNGHLQTTYAAVGNFEAVDQVYYGRSILTYPDGGTGTLDYLITQEQFERIPKGANDILPPRTRFLSDEELLDYNLGLKESKKPMLVVLHGLSGGSFESYVRCTLSKLDIAEFDAVVLNARGCSRSRITTPQLFCGLWTEDIRFLVADLKRRFPARPLYGVGFSLGATILANYIGQEGEDCGMTLACIVGNPWDLAESSYMLHRTWLGKNVYSPVMCKNLKKLLKNNYLQLSKNKNFLEAYNTKIDSVKLITDFDNVFTARMFGFNTLFEYYRHGSPVNRLLNFRIPTLLINAKDDPIVGAELIPYQETEKNPYVTLITTDYGGHLGWFKLNNERWYAQPVVDFFKVFQNTVKLSDKTGKPVVKDEGKLPHKNCFVDDRIQMENNPYYF